jgi:Na+/H+ antiporter NhaC
MAGADQPRSLGRRQILFGALLALVCAGALFPAPSPEALILQGLGRLFDRDLAREGASDGLFHAIASAGGEGAPVHVHVSLDGVPLEGERVARVVRSQLNRFRRGTGAPDAVLPAVQAELSLRRLDGGLAAALHARGPGGSFDARGAEVWRVPGRSALLPALVAIVVALLTRRTLLALFLGVFCGATTLAADSGPLLLAPLGGLWSIASVYLRDQILDQFRIEIVGFIVALIGMVGVMSRAGGMRGLVDGLLGFARTLRSSLLLTFGMGLALFFDDYANCMLVGSTMRPLTDRLRVSREKLAYIVDSTAAPVAGISLLSTWIAFQVSVYEAQLPSVGIDASGYEIFLRSLPYRFYSILTLVFVLLIVLTGRDFGPMARAEVRARGGALVRPGGRPPVSDALSQVEAVEGMTPDWRKAAFPVLATTFVTALCIFVSGGGLSLFGEGAAVDVEALTRVLLAGSGPQPIFVGALAGLALACFLAGSNATRAAIGLSALAAWASLAFGHLPGGPLWSGLAVFVLGVLLLGPLLCRALGPVTRPHLSAGELRSSSISSARTLGFAVALLFLAWMIGAVCEDLGTADYLVALLGDALPPPALPVLLFLLACVVAFATGSSWSTMSILLPNVVGLAGALGAHSGLGTELMVVLCVSAVLEGAIFGDHCSPISDTTVLSSVASGSDHIDHVRTQAPYALVVAGVALLAGYLPVLLVPGFEPLVGLAAGAGLLFLLIRVLGRVAPPARLAEAPNLE